MPVQQPSDAEKNSNARYESDRRGEHAYPKGEHERPSQRDRDELKKRLERQSPGQQDDGTR